MRSYIKIVGPPLLKAIRELEKIAVKTPQVCFMDTIVATDPNLIVDDAESYFDSMRLDEEVTTERCQNVFSKHSEMLGEYDFFFEWFQDPSPSDINTLIERIDNALTPLGCRYMMTTKKK
ncbi:MAG: hypothetical protein QG670_1295 [Thermoproteota archaeon]|nr:hypothetical protein [Thermoproteota archaeon]